MTASPFEHRREAACASLIAFHQILHDEHYPTRGDRMSTMCAYLAGVLSSAVDEDDGPCAATARGLADGLVVIFAEEDRRAGL